MKSFKLPKKNKFKNYLKLFFTLNLLFGLGALGLFFYFSYEKNNPLLSALSPFFSRPTDSEVLSISAGPQPLVRITKYDFNPRPENNTARSSSPREFNNGFLEYGGVDNGPLFPSGCGTSTRGSFNTVENDCNFPFSNPGSPPVIQTWGSGSSQRPVLFYYGGMYEVKRNSDRVQLISRLYSSSNRNDSQDFNVCNRNWHPQVVERDKGDNYYFGHTSLSITRNNCRSMIAGGQEQYYVQDADNREPYNFQYRVKLKTDSAGDLSIDKIWSFNSRYGYFWKSTNNYSNPNHRAICHGKDINGRCNIVTIYKEWTETSIDTHARMLAEGNEGQGYLIDGSIDMGFASLGASNRPVVQYEGIPKAMSCSYWRFENNVPIESTTRGIWTSTALGTRRVPWQSNRDCANFYTGYVVPETYFASNFHPTYEPRSGDSYVVGDYTYTEQANIYPMIGGLSAKSTFSRNDPNPNRCSDENRYDGRPTCRTYSTWRGRNIEAFGYNAIEMWPQRLFLFESEVFNSPKRLGTINRATYYNELVNPAFVVGDYASDAYFFKVNFINNRISVYRFGVEDSQILDNQYLDLYQGITGLSQLDITGNLETKNISFNVNGRGDLDILFAPLPSAVNGNSRARIFRVPNFNNVNPNIAEARRPVMYEMTDTANGYAFTSSRATGEESPLSFEYVNVADGNLTNDYAVFATKNSVWTANIPYGCTMNNVTATFLTNPNSRLNGVVVPTNGSTSYNLGFSISPEPVITCGGTNLPIAGYTLQLIDPLSLNTIPTRNLTSVGNLTNPSFSNNFDPAVRRKWNLKLFAYTSSNTSIQIPIRVSNSESDISGNFSYIEEGSYQLRVFKDIGNGLTAPHNGAVFSIAQTFVQLPNEPSISKPIRGVSLASTSNTTTLNSSFISGYFSDHRLFSAPNSVLNDLVSTQITFIPQNEYQSRTGNFEVSRVLVSPNASNFVITRGGSSPSLPSPRSFSFSYTSSGTVYTLPSNSVITVVLSNVDAPPASVVTTDLRNVSFNSNLVNLKRQVIKGENYTSRNLEGNYLYRYSSASSSNFNKKYELSSSSSQFFEFSIRYTIPTSTPNFSSVNPSGCNSASFGMLNIFNTSQECSLGSNSSILSGPNLKILFVNNGTIKVDLNASLPSQLPILRNTYLIDNNPSIVPGTPKISFALNCDTNPTPFLCLSGNRYFISGGLYRNVRFDGRLQSSQQNDIKMTVSQTGDVLPTLQHHLHRNKIPEIAIRKVILKYK